MTSRKKEARLHEAHPYQVGYGKPPEHTRFCKGQSGNPGGRPAGMTAGRAKALVLEEAYRMVRVEDGDGVVAVPAIQAILRSQIVLASKGNGPAQRAVVAAVQAIEEEMERKARASDTQRQIALLLAREREAPNKTLPGSARSVSGDAPCAAAANSSSGPPKEERK